MAGTALEHGLKRDWYLDERSDPEKATFAAAKYLRTLSGMFDGDWHLALASYNGGPGRVQRAMKRGGVEDFWTLAAKPKLLPRETREYVPMILAAIVIARNPAQYGFDLGGRVARPVRQGHGARPGGSPAGGGTGRRLGERDPGAEPGTAPVDDACPVPGLPAEGARGEPVTCSPRS